MQKENNNKHIQVKFEYDKDENVFKKEIKVQNYRGIVILSMQILMVIMLLLIFLILRA